MGVVDTFNQWVAYFNSNIGGTLLMILLVPTGLFLTFFFRFLQIRKFRHAVDIIRGIYDDPKDVGDVSHFQALTTALSATVGIGNIAGVALAIHYGGPGAIFWMWVTGFVGMMTKFAECTLGLKYRKELPDGTMSGGPMYYMERGLKRFFGTVPAKAMGIFFAIGIVLCSFGSGNMVQSNTVASALADSYNIPKIITAIFITAIVFSVVVGGIKRIARFTSKLVPFMAFFYVGAALLVLASNLGQIAPALAFIVESAFTGTAAVGGFMGSTFIMALRFGVARGLFSNEAGQGSAPIAHAAAKTKYPVREGLVATLEPFIDTLLICTMTALVIVISGAWSSGLQGAVMTSQGFQVGLTNLGLGFLGKHIVTLGVLLFAVSTAISWSYYGDRCVEYLFGDAWVKPYRILFCVAHFSGALWALESVWAFADMALSLVAIPNLIAIIFLSRELMRDTQDYFSKEHKPFREMADRETASA